MSGPPQPATRELHALAAAVRPDWDQIDVRDVLAAARTAGRPWPQMLLELVRLMTEPEAMPRDLQLTARDAWRVRRPVPPPDTAHRGAALARAAVQRTHQPDSPDTEGEPR